MNEDGNWYWKFPTKQEIPEPDVVQIDTTTVEFNSDDFGLDSTGEVTEVNSRRDEKHWIMQRTYEGCSSGRGHYLRNKTKVIKL